MKTFLHTLSTGFFCALLYLPAKAQKQELLTVETFIRQVTQFHPVAKQANLVTEKTAADLLSAKGAFDPVFEWNNNSKSINGIGYYQYSNPELKIPTGIGLNFKGGYEHSKGQFINPEQTEGVASYLGIELPLVSGLVTDKKRTVLKQARLYQQASEKERLVMINDLLLDAYISYWEWAGAYQLYQVYARYVDIAERRSKLVSLSFKNGDRAMADTVEAYAQVQNYRLLQVEALLELNKKAFELSLYLWSGQGESYFLPSSYIPDTSRLSTWFSLPDTAQLISNLTSSHPVLLAGQYKMQVLDAERKLKFQSLLPTVNLQVNLLSKDYYQFQRLSGAYLENNYKFGIHAKLPLLLRQARGEYKSAKLKIEENGLELTRKTWEIQNKIRQYFIQTVQLQQQIERVNEMDMAYKSLLNTEELRFAQGESSLFLVNSRENKVLELQQKIIELRVKYLKAIYAFRWASATIG